MEQTKRTDALIFTFAHKELSYKLPDNKLCTTIQVGADIANKDIYELKDNSIENNISKYNYIYRELTGMYYIWQQLLNNPEWSSYRYIGQQLYRRWLPVSENTDFDKLFDKIDFIAVPRYVMKNLWFDYQYNHFINDLEECGEILKNKYPDYYNTYIKVIYHTQMLYSSQGLILKREDYIKYVKFLFTILSEYVNTHKFENADILNEYLNKHILDKQILQPNHPHKIHFSQDYLRGICGFIAERLMSVFLVHNFKKHLRAVEYIEPEEIDYTIEQVNKNYN